MTIMDQGQSLLQQMREAQGQGGMQLQAARVNGRPHGIDSGHGIAMDEDAKQEPDPITKQLAEKVDTQAKQIEDLTRSLGAALRTLKLAMLNSPNL